MANEKESKVSIIATVQRDGGIGVGDDHQWNFHENSRNWMKRTSGSVYIMGRNTYGIQNSKGNIPHFMNGRTLKVVTSNTKLPVEKGVYRMSSVAEAVKCAKQYGEGRPIFIAGGERVYQEAFAELVDQVDEIRLTRVDGKKEGAKCFLPIYEPRDLEALGFELVETEEKTSRSGEDKGVIFTDELWCKKAA